MSCARVSVIQPESWPGGSQVSRRKAGADSRLLPPMEIIRAPRITLLARPHFIPPAHLPVQWMGDASDGERLAEFAGRLCYMSQHNPAKRSTADYLENIKIQGHGSVLEHAVYVLLLEGI